MQVQVRSEETGMHYFPNVPEAMKYANEHEDVWKVSFDSKDGSRVRLIRQGTHWIYESLSDEIEKLFGFKAHPWQEKILDNMSDGHFQEVNNETSTDL